jgi:hypothetical protein
VVHEEIALSDCFNGYPEWINSQPQSLLTGSTTVNEKDLRLLKDAVVRIGAVIAGTR